VLRRADHVGVEDAGRVQFFDDGRGRDADGADEEFGAAGDDDVDEFVEFAFRVVGLWRLVVNN
jgi:hypothetical protein